MEKNSNPIKLSISNYIDNDYKYNDQLPNISNFQCLPVSLQNLYTQKISQSHVPNNINYNKSSNSNKCNISTSFNSHCDILCDITSINPNIHKLFLKYNLLFFDGKLSQCEVKWSNCMGTG